MGDNVHVETFTIASFYTPETTGREYKIAEDEMGTWYISLLYKRGGCLCIDSLSMP